MLKKILKKVSVIAMGLSIFSLIGCSEMDKEQATDVEKLLQKKYHQEFEVTHIGGRYGTATNDTVTTYVHPKDQKDLVFKAVTTKDGELVSDGYIPSLISKSFNQIITRELSSAGIESETHTVAMEADSSAETNPDISLEEYVKAYKPGYFSGDIIVKEKPDLSPEQFEKALTAAYQAGVNTAYQVTVHVIAEDEYDKCVKKFKEVPYVTSSWFIDYNVVKEFDAVADANGYHFADASATAKDGE
ncbi:hypothetical protein [Neobacillus sp. SAB-20_R2A]|uniref:hypothetical protein n=1 Tax=Neobacillus sp. SAB-20_R2A TaxID=3120519 RepID=UPI003C6DC411